MKCAAEQAPRRRGGTIQADFGLSTGFHLCWPPYMATKGLSFKENSKAAGRCSSVPRTAGSTARHSFARPVSSAGRVGTRKPGAGVLVAQIESGQARPAQPGGRGRDVPAMRVARTFQPCLADGVAPTQAEVGVVPLADAAQRLRAFGRRLDQPQRSAITQVDQRNCDQAGSRNGPACRGI